MKTKFVDIDAIKSLEKVLLTRPGIINSCLVFDSDRKKILKLEEEAETRSLMGLGKVINTGVRKALESDLMLLGLTTPKFSWGSSSSLVLKKGDILVGKELYDEKKITELQRDKNIWFLHKHFYIDKSKISFPGDIMKKVCHFEITGFSSDWFLSCEEKTGKLQSLASYPSTLCDVYLKERYFDNLDERGLGTLLIGLWKIKK